MEYEKLISQYFTLGGLTVEPAKPPAPITSTPTPTEPKQTADSILCPTPSLIPSPKREPIREQRLNKPIREPIREPVKATNKKKARSQKSKKAARARRLAAKKMPTHQDYPDEGCSEESHGSLSPCADDGQTTNAANTTR